MIRIGVDYYPEHWPREYWEKDIRRMKEAGVKVVRIAEFSWSRLEPREGEYDFGWLDEIVKLLADSGMQIILGTPTNCAPLWMYRRYPETLQTERSGQKTATGIRGHRCQTNEKFRGFVRKILSEMARRYAGNPSVIAWQIDNEIEANHCNCKSCTEAFRKFLKEKYKDIGALNMAYGNDVWSGDFSDFDEILTPLGEQYLYGWLNPSYMLDYERFASESTLDYVKFQSEIIKQFNENAVITTNGCFGMHTPDYHKIFRVLDVASYDNYPSLYRNGKNDNSKQAFVLDLVRGFQRKNFWVMEQMSGAFGCWGPVSPSPRPGSIEGYGMQAIAHGADLVMYFRWRTSVKGAEMFCHGILDHSDADNRRFAEFKKMCQRVNALQIPEDTLVKSKVALLYSYVQEHAFKIQQMSEGFTYRLQAEALHRAYTSFGVNIDVIDGTGDLSSYQIILVPAWFVTDDCLAARLEEFVAKGGIAVITNRSGVKDEYNACLMQKLPGPFAKLCGCTVEEYDALGAGIAQVKDLQGGAHTATSWCDILETDSAQPYAFYDSEYYSGKPAASVNKYGQGRAYYLGSVFDDAFYRTLAEETLKASGVSYYKNLPENVEITTRTNSERTFTFIFNNGEQSRCVHFENEVIELAPFEMKILEWSAK